MLIDLNFYFYLAFTIFKHHYLNPSETVVHCVVSSDHISVDEKLIDKFFEIQSKL